MSTHRTPTNEELDGLLKQAEMYQFVVPVVRSVHDRLIAEIKWLRGMCRLAEPYVWNTQQIATDPVVAKDIRRFALSLRAAVEGRE